MKIPPAPHPWRVKPAEAVAIQRRLAVLVKARRPRGRLRWIAGADAAFSNDGRQALAAVVLWDRGRGVVVEEHVAAVELTFPYVPGLLSFREAPSILAALAKLRRRPDVVMLDGHGWAHPRRFGLACHVGLVCRLPSIGCAKTRLTGSYREPGCQRGSRSALIDGGERIGTVLRTREAVKPVFVSVGHRMDLATAERIVLDCAVRYRLPEPTRRADRRVAQAKASL